MFVADLHNDLVQRVIEGEDVTKFTPHGHTDIPRLLESKIDLEILNELQLIRVESILPHKFRNQP